MGGSAGGRLPGLSLAGCAWRRASGYTCPLFPISSGTEAVHILHIVESFGGGVYTVMAPMLNWQVNTHRVSLLHSVRPETPKVLQLDPAISRMELAMPASPGLRVFPAAFAVAKAIKQIRPDVIHLHSSMAGAVGRAAVLLAGFPFARVVYTPHGFSFLRQDWPWLMRKIFFAVEAALSYSGNSLAACSSGEYALARKFTRRAVVARNGIELDKVLSLQRERAPGPLTVAALGRVAPARAPWDFIRVAKMVKALHPEVRFQWIGWGDGGSDLVEWLGAMPREQALSYLSANADIVLHPSLWEGLPLALLEAMALEKPVVARDIIGNREAVLHGVTGYLSHDADGMAERIIELVEDPLLREGMGTAGLGRVLSLFTAERQAETLTEFYGQLVQGSPRYGEWRLDRAGASAYSHATRK